MYPQSFDDYTPAKLLQVLEQLTQTGDLDSGILSNSQKLSLLANLANLRANINQTIQDLDDAIETLSTV